MYFQNFLKKNLKFSFYLKKYVLKQFSTLPGIFYIVRQKGHDCMGVDFGDAYLKIARENFARAGGDPQKIVKGLFQQLPFEDNCFDTVISQETLEHFYFPDIMVGEIGRVLRNGGLFIGSTPLENRIDSETHVLFYKQEGVAALLKQDFEIKHLEAIKNHPTDSHPNIIVWTAEKTQQKRFDHYSDND